jgi:hypothetical protein
MNWAAQAHGVLALVKRASSVVVDVLECQHRHELALVVARNAAMSVERIGVPVGSEQPIPDRQIGKIVAVDVELVVDRVAAPASGSDISARAAT